MLVNQKSSRIKEPPVGTFRSHSHVLRRHQHAAGGFCSAIVSAASGSAGGGPTFLRDTPHELDRGCWKLSVRRPPPWQPHPARQSILLGSPSGPTDATGTRRYLFAVNPYARSVLAPHQCTCLGGTSGNRWKLLPAVVWWRAWPRTGYARHVGWPLDQPVPFSHQIMCRTLPLLPHNPWRQRLTQACGHTCMTSHSQIWTNADLLGPVRESLASGEPITWNRITDLSPM